MSQTYGTHKYLLWNHFFYLQQTYFSIHSVTWTCVLRILFVSAVSLLILIFLCLYDKPCHLHHCLSMLTPACNLNVIVISAVYDTIMEFSNLYYRCPYPERWLYLVANPLQSVTTWSLELIDNTDDGFFPWWSSGMPLLKLSSVPFSKLHTTQSKWADHIVLYTS